MNKIEETTPLEGFRVSKGDFKSFKHAVDNFKYVYIARGRPQMAFNTSDDGQKEEGISLEITAYGITVKGEYTANGVPPDMSTITTDWKPFLTKWIVEQGENWVLTEESIKQN